MYTLFNSTSGLRSSSISTIALDYVRKTVLDVQLPRYREYRKTTPGMLPSDHLLLKILNTINVAFEGDILSYYNKVEGQVNRIIGTMGLSSSGQRGKIFDKGTFYGDNVCEIIIANSDPITPRVIWEQWEKLSCIRVLAHPVRGCSILELDGTMRLPGQGTQGIAVMELNIPLMACQYQLWKMAMRAVSPMADQLPNGYFLSQIVLPNMLMSHLDIAQLNTLRWRDGFEDCFEVPSNLPFVLADLTKRQEDGLDEILRRFNSQTHTFETMLSMVPTYSEGSLLKAVKLPEVAFTTQVLWALLIARLPLIAFLLKIGADTNNEKNVMALTSIRRSLIEAASGKYLTNQMPPKMSTYLAGFIRDNLQPYLKAM